jgi:type 2 lantibiotic biosynthesis protein LanM
MREQSVELRELALQALSLRDRVNAHRSPRSPEAPELTESERDALWPMYSELTRSGQWRERLAAIDAEEDAFWRGVVEHHFDQHETEGLTKGIRGFIEETSRNAGPARLHAGYAVGLPALPGGVEAVAIRYFEEALATAGLRRVEQWDSQDARVTMFFAFLRRLQAFMAPCLVLDLNERAAQGELRGETPEARFADYVGSCTSSAACTRKLFERYPVLASRVALFIRSRCVAMAQMLARWSEDRDTLSQQFNLPASALDSLAEIDGPLGDPHSGGLGVYCFVLASGFRVVYKPRSMALDVGFQQLLTWMNARETSHQQAILNVLDRDTYGWVEFVGCQACTKLEEVDRFYWRQGSHLALLYLLGGRDFLYENVRARGEYPFLIDVECLITPMLPMSNAAFSSTAGRRYLAESVLAVGLLPDWAWGNEEGSRGVTLSPLSLVDGQLVPIETPIWENVGRDDLRLAARRQYLSSSHEHLPHFEGTPVPLNSYVPALVDGFRSTYDLLLQHRGELEGHNGPLAAFRTARSRIVLRQTMDYQRLMQEACHPDYMGDGLDLAALLERLFASLSPRFPAYVVQSEIDQLSSIDVPYFSARGDSHGIWDSGDRLLSPAFFAESSYAGIVRRLTRLCVEDRERQVQIIERSVMLLNQPLVDTTSPLVRVSAECGDEGGRADQARQRQLIAEATSIADRLLGRAFEDVTSLTWLDLAMDYAGNWTQGSLDLGLYEAAEGIAVFLLYLSVVTGEQRFKDAAAKIVKGTALSGLSVIRDARARTHQWVRVFPSVMTFPGSSLYLVMHAEHCLGEPLLSDELRHGALDWMEHAFNCKPRVDFLTGAAGIVHLLLMMHDRYADARSLDLAERHGMLIANAAVEQPQGGVAWKGSLFDYFIGGFSHGTAGIAPALYALAHKTKNDRLFALAHGALAYDRSLFSESHQDWLDLRVPDGTYVAEHPAWCHGAGGIVLGRLLCRPFAPEFEAAIDQDIERGIQVLLRSDWGASDCLCHGNLGNIDIILSAGRRLARRDLVQLAYSKLDQVWRQSRNRGVWRCGLLERNVALPGMFVGLAGIGHALLRLARPDVVPSILSLDCPPRSS